MVTLNVNDLSELRTIIMLNLNASPLDVENFMLSATQKNHHDLLPLFDETGVLASQNVNNITSLQLELEGQEAKAILTSDRHVRLTDYTNRDDNVAIYDSWLTTYQFKTLSELGNELSHYFEVRVHP